MSFINVMERKKPEITFKLVRIEDLNSEERKSVEGIKPSMNNGLVIKEYKSGSFVKLRKFIPRDNSFISQLRDGLEVDDRKKITEHIKGILKQ